MHCTSLGTENTMIRGGKGWGGGEGETDPMMIIIKYWRKRNKSRSKETVATLGADHGQGGEEGGGHRIHLKVCIVPS